jgi:CubicO group peptidase (beta-lactamase class C family)
MLTFPAQRRGSAVLTRRSLALAGGVLAASAGARFGLAAARQATPATGTSPDALLEIVRQKMDELSLRATIIRVEIDGEELVLDAIGESMTGVPATTDMRFRNGAVAISLISTLMLTLVDDGTIGLDDPIATFLPDLPNSGKATFRMLANMTAGYRDHVQSTDFLNTLMDEPFRSYTPDEIIAYSLAEPQLFAPGTNWEYSHTNYFVLGLAMEAATGQSVEQLMQERVLDPLGLTETIANQTAAIPEPTLHAFSSEHRAWLEIPAGKRFYEESTYWNPSWTLTQGAVQTQSIRDFAASMVAVGEGTLLSPASKAAMFEGLLGFGAPLDGCATCRTLNEDFNYGLGVVMHGPWVLQNPMFSGCSGVSGYLPERKISIAVVNTYGEGAFDDQGNYSNSSVPLFQALADSLAPDLATPVAAR